MKRAFVTAAVVLVTGCSHAAEPQPIAALSSVDKAGNATTLATFVTQLCLGRASDLNAFSAALKATGWPAKRTQTANPAKPLELDAWNLPGMTLLRGQPVTGGVWTCSISLTTSFAPNLETIRNALARIAGTKADAKGEWWWNGDGYRFHMDATAANDGSVFINVEDYRLPWWRTILG